MKTKKIVVAGLRFYMKFENYLGYFDQRAQEAGGAITPVRDSAEEDFRREVQDADAIIVLDRKVSADAIEGLRQCRLILALSVGYDCIDVAAATNRQIPVSNVPAYCTDDVANHAMTLLLAVSRKLGIYTSITKAGGWDYNRGRPVFNLRGKTLGIIGLGRIGRAVLPKARGFGFNLIAYDPYLEDDIFSQFEVRRIYDLETLLSESDCISIHAPLTQETRSMLDKRALSLMKPHAVLINTARGLIIDENALIDALKTGKIGGAGLDVLSQEPPGADNELFRLENAIVTPHVAWYSEESFKNAMAQSMDEVVRVLGGRRPLHPVNPEVFWRR